MDFVREQRVPVPPLPTGTAAVTAPPELPKPVSGNPVARLLPVAMFVACVGMMAVYFTSGAASPRNPMMMFFPLMMGMSALGSVIYSARGGVGRTGEIDENRRRYLRYHDSLDESLADVADDQRRAQDWSHPDPVTLWTQAGSRRMWERRLGDSDFGRIRIGTGSLGLCTPLIAPEPESVEDVDPVTVSAMRTLIERRSVVDGLPVTVPMTGTAVIAVEGDASRARALVRAMVCQLAVWHGPDLVRIAAVTGAAQREEWEWLKWLPQHQHPSEVDAAGAARLVFGDLGAAVTAQSDLVPLAMVIFDGGVCEGFDGDRLPDGVTVIDVGATLPEPTRLVRVRVDAGGATVSGEQTVAAVADELSHLQALVCARRLARYELGASTGRAHRTPTARGWLDLIGITDPHTVDVQTRWVRAPQHISGVPIGVAEDGSPVNIDINEAARGGIGPHGLCVGATGSGKSEFLRSLVLGLITAHPSDVLNLILVDFKGGATFLGFERARHVAAVITNLADEAHLVARMSDALAGELHRRQEMLRAAGGLANIADYGRARQRDASLPPLPSLVVIVDEFSELLSQHPDFAELFVAIGRLGRSLGIHLLLASQRLDEGRLRGLDTHLSYRVCLKTFSAAESRAVLGVPDAHLLPTAPGSAYLKTAAGDLVRFRTAFVSGAFSPRRQRPQSLTARRFTAAVVHDPATGHSEPEVAAATVLEAVLDRIAGRGPAAHPVWLPPLAASPTLDMLAAPPDGALSIPIGLVDRPFEQRRDLLTVHLAGAGGNVAIVGAPRSGKSTAVRTLITALANTHSPAQVGFYCLDLGGGSLSALRELPHVGAVAGRTDTDLCRRTVAVMQSLLRSREVRFRALGIDSMAEYRARRGAGDVAEAEDPYGDVFLVVDGWGTLRQEFEQLEAPITAIAAQGLSFGVHVVLTASRWPELRPGLKDQIATRIELRLGDPAESEMDRRRARLLATAPSGRGITVDGRDMVIALPRWDGNPATTDMAQAMAASVDRVRSRWPGACAPRVELLPTVVTHRELVRAASTQRSPTQLVLGVGEDELRPVAADFAEQPHLLALGEAGCGKSSLLRLLCREIVRSASAEEAQLEIVDLRRALLGVVETDHLAGYAASPAALASRLHKLLGRLESRMPGEDVTQQQLRDRSWWSGPEIYLVIDDYDLVAAATGNPLAPLADFLPHASDLGLHVVAARRSGGAARAMFDPVLARMREVGCMGLMMSAGPEEGVLLGSVRPSPQPAGRGTLITRRGGEQLVQIGWVEPA